MFVTRISFRGTLQSFCDLTEVSAQSWYKVRTYDIVNPTFKISILIWYVIDRVMLPDSAKGIESG